MRGRSTSTENASNQPVGNPRDSRSAFLGSSTESVGGSTTRFFKRKSSFDVRESRRCRMKLRWVIEISNVVRGDAVSTGFLPLAEHGFRPICQTTSDPNLDHQIGFQRRVADPQRRRGAFQRLPADPRTTPEARRPAGRSNRSVRQCPYGGRSTGTRSAKPAPDVSPASGGSE